MTMYVTEPDAIDLAYLERLLEGSGYKMAVGDTSFHHDGSSEISALLIKSQTRVDRNILDYFPNLQHVIRAGTGLDNVDVEFCKQQGISLHNAPGANSESVAEYTIMAMLMALRRVKQITSESLANWDRSELLGQNLSSQTVGIVGYGHIGRLVHERLNAFGCREILVHDPALAANAKMPEGSQLVGLDTLLRSSSVVTLHVPLLPETRHMIDRKRLQSLTQGAILINAARGGLVDEQVLVEVARSRQLTYVADTTENEPAVRQDLLNSPNIILTPHIAGYTRESSERALSQAIDSFLTAVNRQK